MKKKLLLLVAFFVNMVCLAQTNTLPLVVEGRTWSIVSLIPTESPESESTPGYYKDIKGRWGRDVFGGSTYTIQGDTIMDGIAYKKLLSTNGDFCCGLREEEGRLYKRAWAWDPTGPEVLFFDFNLQSGDIIKDPVDELFLLQVKQVKKAGMTARKKLLPAAEKMPLRFPKAPKFPKTNKVPQRLRKAGLLQESRKTGQVEIPPASELNIRS